MSAAIAAAIVPVVGALGFLALASRAFAIDSRLRKVEDPTASMHLRAMSQAAADPSREPHWYWLASSCMYAPAIMATAIWQNEAATAMGKEDTVMMTMGVVSGAMFFVTAVSPNFQTSVAGHVWHAVTAGIFIATGMSYVFRASFLEVVSGDAVSTVRFIMAGIVAAGILSMVCGLLFLYYVAAKKLEDAAKPGATPLDPKEERQARLSIAALAVVQMAIGLGLAGGLASGAAEVAELPPDLLATGCAVGGGVLVLFAGCGCGAFQLCGRGSGEGATQTTSVEKVEALAPK